MMNYSLKIIISGHHFKDPLVVCEYLQKLQLLEVYI